MTRRPIPHWECGGNDAALPDEAVLSKAPPPLRSAGALQTGVSLLLSCVTVVLAVTGCPKEAKDDVLLRGYACGKADQWDAARPFVREYLLDHPGDAGAHFLWGQCHLHGPTPWLEIARGEFAVTLQLIEKEGHSGLLNADLDSKKLTIMAHQETARACFRQIYLLAENKESADIIRRIAKEALLHVEKGLSIGPDIQELRDMREELNRQLGQEPQSQPPPRKTPSHTVVAV